MVPGYVALLTFIIGLLSGGILMLVCCCMGEKINREQKMLKEAKERGF